PSAGLTAPVGAGPRVARSPGRSRPIGGWWSSEAAPVEASSILTLLLRHSRGYPCTVPPLTRGVLLLTGLAVVTRSCAQGPPDPWRPRTMPACGASYAPDIGLVLGAVIMYTRV